MDIYLEFWGVSEKWRMYILVITFEVRPRWFGDIIIVVIIYTRFDMKEGFAFYKDLLKVARISLQHEEGSLTLYKS